MNLFTFFQSTHDTTAKVTQHATEAAQHGATAGGHGGEMGISEMFKHLIEHIQDSREIELPFLGHVHLPHFDPIQIGSMTLDLSITKHVVFMWVAAAILILLMVLAARQNSRNRVPKGFGNLVEVFVKFVRDEIALPNMGPSGLRYMPYLLTTFFFILLMNLLGLIPYGASATGNLAVTAGLAVIAFIMIQVAAIRAQGFGHYLAHLTGGVPAFLWPIMIPVEILGLFTKPFALCMRLFANMTGGHLVLVSLIGLIFVAKILGGTGIASGVGLVAGAFVVAIMFLELFVAFLQAYVFTMLTSIFMGLGIQAGEQAHSHHDHSKSH